MAEPRLLIFGLGYTGTAVMHAAADAGFAVTGTVRGAGAGIPFDDAAASIAQSTHLLSTVPPDASGDPVLLRYADAIGEGPHLRWVGYLSTTGVYGDRKGDWVDEGTEPAPMSDRSRRRLVAEQAWGRLADRRAIDIFRLAGIYGPGRSVFDDLRAGTARLVGKPGHTFGRIHRDDIVSAVIAAMQQTRASGIRVLNLVDDEPTESADVIAEAARLLGVTVPEATPFELAWTTMSPMARSFWAEHRKVSSLRTQRMLGLRWRYPSYREGLRAILAEESGKRPA
jgi:nucleoside-diphosphate-sugar epimerase